MRMSMLRIACCLFLGLLIISCAGTNNGQSSGSTDQSGSATGAASSEEEAEVLRLLGITKDEAAESQQTETSSVANRDSNDWQALEERVDNLQSEVSQKELELANLKARLADKEEKIDDIQEELAKTPKTPASNIQTSASFKARYDQALAMYYDKDYKGAIAEFQELINTQENNSLMDNCQYWKGECYYAMMDYEKAIMEFSKVGAYSDSNKLDDAQLKIALSYLRMSENTRAAQEFQKLIDEYPNSEYVGRAQAYLSQL